MATAYKYAANDRPLNVVILSDGLTDQQSGRRCCNKFRSARQHPCVLHRGRQRCKRPLLEQLAEIPAVLASYLSGDNFDRQAKAFRQKLMRALTPPPGDQVRRVDVTDVEPTVLPISTLVRGKSLCR